MGNKNYSGKKNGNKSRNSGKGQTRSNGAKRGMNFQDKFADREKAKGRREEEAAIQTGSSDNDPSWYIPTGQMAKDAASFPTNYPVGSPVRYHTYNIDNGGSTGTVSCTNLLLPGVLAYDVVPTFGIPTKPEDPANVAMNTLFRDIRSATSGTSYYEAQDLLMYITSVGSAYSWYAHLVRAYGTLNTYSVLNRYVPDALITAMGFNASDLRTNASNLRAYINQIALKLASFAIPNNLNYIIRQIFLYENTYMDANTEKAQYYLYRPEQIFRYQVVTSSGTTVKSVQAVTVPSNLDYAGIVSFTDSLINALIQQEDLRYMSADILKRYGNSLFKVSQIADNYSIVPVYNAEVLSQFENAFIYPGFVNTHELTQNVAVGNAYLTETLELKTNGQTAQQVTNAMLALQEQPYVINFHHDPTPEDILVATRLSAIDATLGTSTSTNTTFTINSCGSEIIVGAYLFYYDYASNQLSLTSAQLSSILNVTGTTSDDRQIPYVMDLIGALSRFDWQPKLCPVIAGNTTPNLVMTTPLFDVENYIVLQSADLKLLNYTALLGELVPNDVTMSLV